MTTVPNRWLHLRESNLGPLGRVKKLSIVEISKHCSQQHPKANTRGQWHQKKKSQVKTEVSKARHSLQPKIGHPAWAVGQAD